MCGNNWDDNAMFDSYFPQECGNYGKMMHIEVMRRSNCSAIIPPPPGQSRGHRKTLSDKKGRGT